jgi:hypothetical protein
MVAVLFTSAEDKQLITGVASVTSPPSSGASVVPRTTNNGKSKLPHNFLPSPHAVICGRGKACSCSPGNKNLKKILNSYLKSYSKARNKLEKSAIVSCIVGSIKQAAPTGAFVKFEGGAWWEVEDGVAREKVGCLLRDSLHTQYRSSTKAKLARRRAKNRRVVAGDEMSLNTSSSNHSSHGFSWNSSSNHSHSYSSSPDLNNSSSSFFSSSGLVEEIVEPVSIPSCCRMIKKDPPKECEQEPSCLPIQDFFSNCSLQQQSPVRSSNNFSIFRDIVPMSAHLDIMGSCTRKRDDDDFNEEYRGIPRALQQACDLLTSFEQQDDMDLPDDLSDIFD